MTQEAVQLVQHVSEGEILAGKYRVERVLGPVAGPGAIGLAGRF